MVSNLFLPQEREIYLENEDVLIDTTCLRTSVRQMNFL